MLHSTIRGEFIRRYENQKDQSLKSGWNLINERNELHRELNIRFNYAEPDGSFSIGCKSHIDQEYRHCYETIETQFRGPYDDQLPALHRWCIENSMTIFECLLIDDIWDEDLKVLASRAAETEDWQLRPIGEKASLQIARLKDKHSVGEIRQRIDIDISNQGYASSRCRKMLEIKPWHLPQQKAILEYASKWKKALNQAFSVLNAR